MPVKAANITKRFVVKGQADEKAQTKKKPSCTGHKGFSG
jgi:hypothetical protein